MNGAPRAAAHELRPVRVVVGFALLALATAALVRAGEGRPSVPLPWDRDLVEWIDETSPATAAVGLLRVTGLGLCGYLAIALAAVVVADVAPRRRLAQSLRGMTPSFVRRVVTRSARSGLTTGVVLGWLGSMVTGPGTATAEPTPPVTASTASTTSAPSTADDPSGHAATMSKLGPAEASGVPASATMVDLDAAGAPPATTVPAPVPGPVSPNDQPAPRPPGTADWVVAKGESFWSIAEEALTEARGGASPDDREVARYWQQLIAANRDRLVAPGNPDLLLAGQVLHVPPPTT